jgi:hypothetical protein
MTSISPANEDSDLIQKTLNWIINVGINGVGTLPSAEEVATDHLSKSASVEDAINSIIKWRTAYATGTGFLTGLGGIATAPVTIPVGLAASYVLGANLAASIAYLRGYDIQSDQVKTAVLLCLVGEVGEGMLKLAGIEVGKKLTRHFIMQKIPKEALSAINKLVPVAGGIIGGAFDGTFVNSCGKLAKATFPIASTKISEEA